MALLISLICGLIGLAAMAVGGALWAAKDRERHDNDAIAALLKYPRTDRAGFWEEEEP